MSLELKILEPVETNSDGTVLIVEDNTGDGNTGWGTGTNPDFTGIDGTNYFLTLTVKISTSADTTGTTYDAVDFYTWYGQAPVNLTDIVFALTMADLKETGVAIGDSDDNFEDGFYEFTYTLKNIGGVTVDTLSIFSLISTQVKNLIYDKLYEIPESFLQNNKQSNTKDYQDSIKLLYLKSFLDGIESNVSVARKTKLLEMLTELEILLTDYPNF